MNKIGNTLRFGAEVFENSALVDPTTLVLEVTTPSGAVSTFSWPGDPEIVRLSVGQFAYDFIATEAGVYSYTWTSDAVIVTSDTGTAYVAGDTVFRFLEENTNAPVEFVDVEIRDATERVVAEAQTDEDGEITVNLDVGDHTVFGERTGWRFPRARYVQQPVASASADFFGEKLVATGYLTTEDLEHLVGAKQIDRLFDDDGDGLRDERTLRAIVRQAESQANAKLLRNWPATSINDLMAFDEGLRLAVGWIAIELASERRGEFVAEDGRGRYWAQYERAMEHLSDVAKSKDLTQSARKVGRGGNEGAALRPTYDRERNAGSRFSIAPEGRFGKGGF